MGALLGKLKPSDPTVILHVVWYVMSGLKPLFNLSVYFEFRAFMTFLGPKELTKVGSIFFDPPNP